MQKSVMREHGGMRRAAVAADQLQIRHRRAKTAAAVKIKGSGSALKGHLTWSANPSVRL